MNGYEFFETLMLKCMDFLRYPITIWGCTFSIWNVLIFTEIFDIFFHFYFRLFGGAEVDYTD